MTQDVYLQQLFLGKLIIILGVVGVIAYVFILMLAVDLTPYQTTQSLICKGLQGYG